MREDAPFYIIFGFCGLVMLTIFGAMAFEVYADHKERLACIQTGRTVVEGSCVKLAGDAP